MDSILDEYISSDNCHASAAGFTFLKANGSPRMLSCFKGSLGLNSCQPFKDDSLIWLASASKLVTSVAVLIAVEKGLLQLEDEAAMYLKELSDPDILIGFEESIERPILKKAINKITLHQLLTHTSGLAYRYATEEVKRWAKYNGKRYGGVPLNLDDCLSPLLFEPGTGWEYGPGIDWAGRIIENITGKNLEDFCKANIWDKIGAHDTTFRPATRLDLLKNRLQMAQPTRDNGILRPELFPLNPEEDLGGLGLWTTPRDFNLFLWHLFFREDGLLKPESLDFILSPQVPDSTLVTEKIYPFNQGTLTQTFPDHLPLSVGFGSCIALQDIAGRRPKGSISGVGLANVHWWFDPTNRICGVLYMQLIHGGLSETNTLLINLEKAVYEEVRYERRSNKL